MTRLTPTELVRALRAEGVRVVKVTLDGHTWPDNTTAGTFNPHGTMNHHTGSSGKDIDIVKLLWRGRPDLDGPLCHFGLGHDGTCYLVGWDNVNHAGNGDPDVLKAVVEDRPAPVANEDVVDGNPNFWAIEVMNNGTGEAYPLVQINALVKINAAIARASGWTENSSIHHREWTRRKIDMSYHGPLRQYVAECLALPPGVWQIPGLDPKGKNVRAALSAAYNGAKWAWHFKRPTQVTKWKRVINSLRK